MEDQRDMSDNNLERKLDRANWNSFPTLSFTPANRVLNGALLNRVRRRISEGYYDSGQILKDVAERITGKRDK